jgi:hypothetical protein
MLQKEHYYIIELFDNDKRVEENNNNTKKFYSLKEAEHECSNLLKKQIKRVRIVSVYIEKSQYLVKEINT